MKIQIIFLALLISAGTQAQTLFTYGNKSVSKQEFLKAYRRNNTDTSSQSYRDYLDLYIRFKLKVQAALDMKLDTTQPQRSELSGFRNQIVDAYMNDEASMNVLVDEALARSAKDIRVAHIFVSVKKGASRQEVIAAKSKIDKAYKELSTRRFDDVALEYSEDPSVTMNRGEIGYVNTFVLPYAIESAVYSTPPNQYSRPVQTSAGFHIVKNLGERGAVGTIRVAHILVSFKPDMTDSEKKALRRRADSISTALRRGADFREMALRMSDDNITYTNGGQLADFGVGRYQPAFENAAFALQKDGDISEPVLTEYGYHIIKRLEAFPYSQKKLSPNWREEVRQQVAQSDRAAVSKGALVKKVQQQAGFRKFPVNLASLQIFTDSVLSEKDRPRLKDLSLQTPLFSFKKRTVRVEHWANYLESIRHLEHMTRGKSTPELLSDYIETVTLEYYRDHLEDYNPEFVYQLKEFKEGNLLFDIMQRKVWDVAAADSLGLRAFFERNKSSYWWEPSAEAILITASGDQTALQAKQLIQLNWRNWRNLSEINGVQVDSGRYELSQIPVPGRTMFSPGLITADVKNDMDSSITFSYIISIYQERQPRSFEDSKGFVINDYQMHLENRWINDLRKKYPVRINEAVLKSLP